MCNVWLSFLSVPSSFRLLLTRLDSDWSEGVLAFLSGWENRLCVPELFEYIALSKIIAALRRLYKQHLKPSSPFFIYRPCMCVRAVLPPRLLVWPLFKTSCLD